MSSYLVRASKASRLGLILVLILLLPGWTCSAIVNFNGCTDSVAQPQITSISPQSIPANTASVLTVDGSAFASQSKIFWNGHPLQTTFIDSRHLQAAISQQTFASFGGQTGGSVFIWVNTPVTSSFATCATGATSTEMILVID